MKSEFPIFLAAALLLGSSGAGAAQTNHNIILAPPISSTPPQTNSGTIGLLNPANPAFGTSQNFGALPGNPGSPTYNPNAAEQPGVGPRPNDRNFGGWHQYAEHEQRHERWHVGHRDNVKQAKAVSAAVPTLVRPIKLHG